jgi:hypothetical protein
MVMVWLLMSLMLVNVNVDIDIDKCSMAIVKLTPQKVNFAGGVADDADINANIC